MGGGGCLAVAWFGGTLLALAMVLMWPVASLSALGCPSGGPDCGPMRALGILFGGALAAGFVFAAVVIGLEWAGRRWRAAAIALAVVGLALLAVPALALARAILVGDAWLTFVGTAVWLIVPGLAILADARSIVRGRRSG